MSQSFSYDVWSKPTKAIFNGIILYFVGGFLSPIFDFVGNVVDDGSMVFTIIGYLLSVAVLVGVILYILGLGKFSGILDSADSAAVSKIRTGAILLIVGAVVDFIPLLGWVAGILNIIAYVLMLIGFSTLKKSANLPEAARKGASLLFISMVLVVVGTGVGLIPVIGAIVKMILNPVAFVLLLLGWLKVKNAVTA